MKSQTCREIWNTNSGFTIVEVLIASGIVAVAMLGITQMGTMGMTSAKSNTLDLDFAILTSSIQTALNSDCSRILLNAPIPTTASPTPTFSSLTIGGYSVVAIPSPLPTVGLVVTSISLNQAPVQVGIGPLGTEYQTNLHITATKVANTGAKLLGAPVYTKDFPLLVWANAGNQIQNCAGSTIPTNAVLTLTPGCNGTTPIITAVWTATNATSVSSAELLPVPSGSPVALPVPLPSGGYAIPATLLGVYSYELLLTDMSGVQTFAVPSPTPSTVTAPATCP